MMSSTRNLAGLATRTSLLLAGALSASVACAASTPAPAAPAAPGGDVVAKVDGKAITNAELLKAAEAQLGKLKQQEYDIKKRVLDDMINQMLIDKEAGLRKISAEELVHAEVDAKAADVTDVEVNGFYDANKARFPQDKTEQELKGLIRTSLQQQKVNDRRVAFLAEQRTKYGVQLLLDPPRATIGLGAAAIKGPATAPVTIVEFSDFQCPFCSRVTPTLKQIEDTYGDKVRVAFRHYPLSFHPMAQKAAEAADCAKEQGKFWQMHDSMFGNQGKLAVDDLKARATELGLNAEQFNACLDSGKTAANVATDLKEGTAYGVTGTPAFFINGRFVNGAVPFDTFATVINEELDRAGIKPPPKPTPTASAAPAPAAAAGAPVVQKAATPPTP
jgi:protein-disulfide isomerase